MPQMRQVDWNASNSSVLYNILKGGRLGHVIAEMSSGHAGYRLSESLSILLAMPRLLR